MDRLTVAIYSFNRGPWLANCVASVQRNLPGAQLVVVDDGSDDPETRKIIAALGPSVQLVFPRQGDVSGRHGGLYPNMQHMLDHCDTPFLLSLQDDAQVVRPVGAEEMHDLFVTMLDRRLAFVSPLFAQGRSSRRRPKVQPFGDARLFLQWNSRLRAPNLLAYRDISICDVEKLRAIDWRYGISERSCAQSARAAFGPMPLMADPFVAFVPEVPTFRARNRTLGAQIAERILGRQVKPFEDMTDATVQRLKQRSPVSPVPASDFLVVAGGKAKPPYEPNAVDVFRVTRFLNKMEVALRRGISRLRG